MHKSSKYKDLLQTMSTANDAAPTRPALKPPALLMQQFYSDLTRTLQDFFQRVPRAARKAAAIAALVLLLTVAFFTSRSHGPEAATGTVLVAQPTAPAAAPAQTAEQRFAARVGINHEAIDLDQRIIDTRKIEPLPPHKLQSVDEETLWLARGLYSETNRPEEMELVAWSIRNRVETSYRGKDTYEEVVLDPWQFSAFNHNSGKRGYFTSLTPSSQADLWAEALTIAKVVKEAPAELRPFSLQTRHYYSERSMVGRRQPAWAVGETPVSPNRLFELEAQRFRFYENIA